MDNHPHSHLEGELGLAVDKHLAEGERIVFEARTYRGHGLVLTDRQLLLVVGGVLAGLKQHEQHVHALPLEKITGLSLEPEPAGCFAVLGIPPCNLRISTAADYTHDAKWDTLTVDYPRLSDAVRIIALIHEQIGKRSTK